MTKLEVSIEIKGRMREVGILTGSSEYDASFTYSEDYLAQSAARPISISLPLREEPFGPEQTGNFFEGLLPEGFLRRKVAENNRADNNDYFSLLELLGAECLGAIQIKGSSYDVIRPEYRQVDRELMGQLAAEGATLSADLVVESHLSLTGASGKVGMYKDQEGRWYLPIGTAPSTHILKQSHIRYDHIVQNEQLALRTAAAMGIEIPHSEIIQAEYGENIDGAVRNELDSRVLLATERYDRDLQGSINEIDGLPVPLRLHQEDFAQALGISSSGKYERPGDEHMKKMFELLRRYSAEPIGDQMKLWDIIVFHYLIGNTDGHIKNFSLIYDSNLRSVRLAPAYDIVSTIVYDTHSSEMAFSIGGETEWNRLGRDSFERAAEDIGLSKNIFMKRFDDMSAGFETALRSTAEEMSSEGYNEVMQIADKILELRK